MIQTVKGGITHRATQLLLVSIAVCILEGALRKWIFRESGGSIKYVCYFAKDFIFGAILFCRPARPFNNQLKTVLLFGLPLTATGALLSSVHDLNIVGGVLSLRALIVLPVLAYFAIARRTDAKRDSVAALICFGSLRSGFNFARNGFDCSSPPRRLRCLR